MRNDEAVGISSFLSMCFRRRKTVYQTLALTRTRTQTHTSSCSINSERGMRVCMWHEERLMWFYARAVSTTGTRTTCCRASSASLRQVSESRGKKQLYITFCADEKTHTHIHSHNLIERRIGKVRGEVRCNNNIKERCDTILVFFMHPSCWE